MASLFFIKPLYLALLMALLAFASVNRERALEANHAYEAGAYSEAERLYRELLEEAPDNAHLLFNLGNTLAQQGEKEESAEMFRRFRDQAGHASAKALAEYNLGHVHAEKGKADEALAHFKEALRHDPDDTDAKFNYELLRRRQQEKEQDQEEMPQQETPPSPGTPPPFSGDDSESQEKETEEPTPSEMDDAPLSDEEEPGARPEISDEQLEHASDIMNALEQIEKDLIKDFLKRQHDPAEPHEKDW